MKTNNKAIITLTKQISYNISSIYVHMRTYNADDEAQLFSLLPLSWREDQGRWSIFQAIEAGRAVQL